MKNEKDKYYYCSSLQQSTGVGITSIIDKDLNTTKNGSCNALTWFPMSKRKRKLQNIN